MPSDQSVVKRWCKRCGETVYNPQAGSCPECGGQLIHQRSILEFD